MTDLNQLVYFKQFVGFVAHQTKVSKFERERVVLFLNELLDDFEQALAEDTPLSRYASRHNYRPIDLDLLSSILVSWEWSFSLKEYELYALYPRRFDRLELLRQIKSSPVIRTPIVDFDLECERGEPFQLELRPVSYNEDSFVSEVVVYSGILAGEGSTVEGLKLFEHLGTLYRDRLRKGYTGPWEFEEALLIAMVKANDSRYLDVTYTDEYLAATIPRTAFKSLVEKGVLEDNMKWIQFKREVDLFG